MTGSKPSQRPEPPPAAALFARLKGKPRFHIVPEDENDGIFLCEVPMDGSEAPLYDWDGVELVTMEPDDLEHFSFCARCCRLAKGEDIL